MNRIFYALLLFFKSINSPAILFKEDHKHRSKKEHFLQLREHFSHIFTTYTPNFPFPFSSNLL